MKQHIKFTDTRPGYKNRGGQFITLPKMLTKDPNLSDAEYRILTYLHDRAGNPDIELYNATNKQWCRIAFPGMKTIAEDTNRSERQAQEVVTSLSLKGYLMIKHVKVAKGIRNEYKIMFPESYQALDNVGVHELYVETGKKIVKKTKEQPQVEGTEEFRSMGTEEFRTMTTEEFLWVNSSIETAPSKTGINTYQLPAAAGTKVSEETTSSGETDCGSAAMELSSSTLPLASEATAFGAIFSASGNLLVDPIAADAALDSPVVLVESIGAEAPQSSPFALVDEVTADALTSDSSVGESNKGVYNEMVTLPEKPVYVEPTRNPYHNDFEHQSRVSKSEGTYLKALAQWRTEMDIAQQQKEARDFSKQVKATEAKKNDAAHKNLTHSRVNVYARQFDMEVTENG